jgi:two-component system chemotaxis response regulator CheY
MYYREILEAEDFSVDEALNGIEGLEKIMSHSFDLLLVDVNMPKMDGYSFLSRLLCASDLQAVPAIMISTEARDCDRIRAYAAGANIYLVKPVDPLELATYSRFLTGLAPLPRART